MTQPAPTPDHDAPAPALTHAVQELAARWQAARLAALLTVAPLAPPAADAKAAESDARPDDARPDDAVLVAALNADADAALRAAFDNSLRLGEGFRRYHRLDLPLADLADMLPQLGVPCLQRNWQHDPAQRAVIGTSPGCATGSLHPQACALHREAIEGLILGATSAVRHARHRSVGAGDGGCVDVLHIDPRSPLRFGAVEPAVATIVDAAIRAAQALDSRVSITILGLSEGVLYYQSKRGEDAGPLDPVRTFVRTMSRRLPTLQLREVSARPVLAPDA